ncbi:hypothetical protein [Frondihabitans australicus]|uniref:Transcriptional regulator with AbiEi antitoxin domain of type IV toxin-antitoxin system n=1 Tax=Frondihabitans australicus TaxID=386892 RepID=A0A495IK51_9MICO|nr:hypothetical protein [Frondihabitans australicus]RKR75671.1 hypothetical protein C8E83_2819 [Frondihabitans australicus]
MDLNAIIGALAAAGVHAWPVTNNTLSTDSGERIRVSDQARSPTPSAIAADLQIGGVDRILYSVPTMTQSLRMAVTKNDRLVVVAEDTRSLWLHRVEHAPDRPPARKAKKGPRPFTRLALGRSLLLGSPQRKQNDLARDVGSPQSAVSQQLKLLRGLVERHTGGYSAPTPSRLWDYCMAEYPGAGGITTYWWNDTSLEQQARAVQDRVRDLGGTALISGDLAARVIAPWRQPEHATLYLDRGLDPGALGFALASRDDHTLSITVPDDATIFATARAHSSREGLVDAVIAAVDVSRTGTTGDEDEGADRIRGVVLDNAHRLRLPA